MTKDGRRSKKAKDWCHDVKKRDGFKCRNCGVKNNLHAHHIIPWKVNERLRFELDNGLTLCGSCHARIELTGQKYTDERKRNMSRGHSGQKAWNKGKTLSEKHKKSLSESHKGNIPWNKGIRSEIPKRKICKDCRVEKEINCFTPQGKWYTNRCKSCRNFQLRKKNLTIV